jgi:hypothetical protein
LSYASEKPRRPANWASSADLAVEFVKPGFEEAREISQVLLMEIDESRCTSGQIVDRGFCVRAAATQVCGRRPSPQRRLCPSCAKL